MFSSIYDNLLIIDIDLFVYILRMLFFLLMDLMNDKFIMIGTFVYDRLQI